MDTTIPNFDITPADETISCEDQIPSYNVVASDNCDNDVLVELVSQNTVFPEDESTPDNCFSVISTWVATDNCGNTNTHTQTVTIEDLEAPDYVNPPSDQTIQCTDEIPTYDIMATDNCTDDVDIILDAIISTQTSDGSSTDNCYTITLSWYASDDCGNGTEHIQVLTVIDSVAPIFVNMPTDETIQCDVDVVTPVVTASDNCDDDVEVDVVITSTQTSNGSITDNCYEITNTWTATDNCGNSNTHTQVITVMDTTIPTFDVEPVDETIECDVTPTIVDVTATDNCDTDVLVELVSTTTQTTCLLYTSPSPRDRTRSRMPSSA